MPDQKSFWVTAVKDVGIPTGILLYILMSISPKLDRIIDQQSQIVNVLLQQRATANK